MLTMGEMTPTQALDFFGSRRELAEVCEVTVTAVHHWVRKGWIPYDKQCLIQLEAQRKKNAKGVPMARRQDVPERKAA